MILCDTDGEAIALGEGAGNISVSANGTINYTVSDGDSEEVMIGLATFTTTAGLIKFGDNLYVESNSSEEPWLLSR
jgi:flagellar basal body rod protein FlgG